MYIHIYIYIHVYTYIHIYTLDYGVGPLSHLRTMQVKQPAVPIP